MHPLQRQHKMLPPVKMNRLSKYCRREIYSLGTVKRLTVFKHQKSIIRTEEKGRIWWGLNRCHKNQTVVLQASALTTPFETGRKLIYIPENSADKANFLPNSLFEFFFP